MHVLASLPQRTTRSSGIHERAQWLRTRLCHAAVREARQVAAWQQPRRAPGRATQSRSKNSTPAAGSRSSSCTCAVDLEAFHHKRSENAAAALDHTGATALPASRGVSGALALVPLRRPTYSACTTARSCRPTTRIKSAQRRQHEHLTHYVATYKSTKAGRVERARLLSSIAASAIGCTPPPAAAAAALPSACQPSPPHHIGPTMATRATATQANTSHCEAMRRRATHTKQQRQDERWLCVSVSLSRSLWLRGACRSQREMHRSSP